jgi:hypothetical protein
LKNEPKKKKKKKTTRAVRIQKLTRRLASLILLVWLRRMAASMEKLEGDKFLAVENRYSLVGNGHFIT